MLILRVCFRLAVVRLSARGVDNRLVGAIDIPSEDLASAFGRRFGGFGESKKDAPEAARPPARGRTRAPEVV